MAKVLCKLPNASTNINGVRFVTHRDGMISEEIDDEVALNFSNINGYEIYDPDAARKKAAAETQGEGQKTNPQQPPAGAPAGVPSSPPASGTAPAGGTPPAAPPAGAQAPAGGATGQGTDASDPKF